MKITIIILATARLGYMFTLLRLRAQVLEAD